MTGSHQYFTWSEIHDQPRALDLIRKNLSYAEWTDTLSAANYDRILLSGCGSSYYLSMIAAHTFSTLLGRRAGAAPLSELLFYPEVYLNDETETLVFVTSRTGETTEALRVVKALKTKPHAKTVTLTCYETSQLARLGDYQLVITVGKEESVVMTKAFSCILLTLTYIAYQSAGKKWPESVERIPAIIQESLTKNGPLIQAIAMESSLKNFAFLGSGPFYGLACEAMLKIKEMASVPATAFHTLEFRHGPKAALSEDTLVVIFVSEKEKFHLKSLLEEVRGAGAKIFMIGHRLSKSLLKYCDYQVSFPHKLEAHLYPIVYAHLMQLLGYWKAIALGLNPDQPRHLSKVVLL
jgi:glucosamine--fructose-6-phosphate aminotransferase (isomerizing)